MYFPKGEITTKREKNKIKTEVFFPFLTVCLSPLPASCILSGASTWALYCKYMAFVLRVHGFCTASTWLLYCGRLSLPSTSTDCSNASGKGNKGKECRRMGLPHAAMSRICSDSKGLQRGNNPLIVLTFNSFLLSLHAVVCIRMAGCNGSNN